MRELMNVVVELAPGRWYLLREQPGAVAALDWRQGAWCHGPFASSDLACAFLDQEYPAPPQVDVQAYQPDFALDTSWRQAIETAQQVEPWHLADLQRRLTGTVAAPCTFRAVTSPA